MDKKAKKILFQAYWSAKGWRENAPKVTEENLIYAMEKGLMFPPFSIDHNQLIEKTIQLRNSLKLSELVKAFLVSLSSRRLDLRSALFSYQLSTELVPHGFQPMESQEGYSDMSYLCQHCHGLESMKNTDLNVLNFERIKWGGVRHEQVMYQWFDLREFSSVRIPDPSSEDLSILQNILALIDISPSKLKKELPTLLPSNQNERQTLISQLTDIGVIGEQSEQVTTRLFRSFLQ